MDWKEFLKPDWKKIVILFSLLMILIYTALILSPNLYKSYIVNNCNKLSSSRFQIDCYSNMALKNNNPDICKEISDISNRHECYVNIALSKNDESFCNKTGVFVSPICYTTVIANRNDESLCDKGESIRDICIALIKENPQLCLNINRTMSTKSDCLSLIAQKKENISVCDILNNETLSPLSDLTINYSIDSCYDEYAMKKLESKLCRTDICYWYVAIFRNDPLLCGNLEDIDKNLCLNDIKTLYSK